MTESKKRDVLEEGQIPAMVRAITRYIVDPAGTNQYSPNDYQLELTRLYRFLKREFPNLEHKDICPNCGASMWSYVERHDFFIACLVIKMGYVLKTRLRVNPDFTQANKFHISKMPELSHTEKCKSTQARHLGLIAKVDGLANHWAITTRGFAFLRNEPVPAWVKVWRNEIIDRPEESDKTTLTAVLQKRQQEVAWSPQDFYEQELHDGRML